MIEHGPKPMTKRSITSPATIISPGGLDVLRTYHGLIFESFPSLCTLFYIISPRSLGVGKPLELHLAPVGSSCILVAQVCVSLTDILSWAEFQCSFYLHCILINH